jgi:ElaB/YqjD/DUF883 family membrane-anchored ribosome-binding protein
MFLNKPAEKSTNLIDQATQTADQAIKSTQQAANEALESLADAVHDLQHQAAPMLGRATDQVSALAHRGVDSVRETSHQLRLKATHASDNTVNYIKDEPIKSILIAAATGAALMALISLISRASDRT